MISVDRQRWLDRFVGPALCWLLTVVIRPSGGAQPPAPVRRVLVILLSEMGALVLTQPMFARLRADHPSAVFYVLCSEQNRPALDLLDVVPAHQIITVKTGTLAAFTLDSVRAVRRMRTLRLDAVLDLELFARTSAVFAGLSGARIKAGFHRYTQEGLYRGNFLNRPVLYNPYQHISQQFVTLAAALGSTDIPAAKRQVSGARLPVPPLRLQPGELTAARDRLHRAHPSLADRPIAFLCPGAGLLPIRAWPLESFSRLAQQLVARGYAVAIVGVPADRHLAQAIQHACGVGTCVDLTGYTASVRDVTVLLHLGALLVTNDGGTGHFASLTPVPTIMLFGPETPILYGSLSPRAVNMHVPMSCSPCLTAYNHRQSPCNGDNVCLKSISVDDVLAAAERLLEAAPTF